MRMDVAVSSRATARVMTTPFGEGREGLAVLAVELDGHPPEVARDQGQDPQPADAAPGASGIGQDPAPGHQHCGPGKQEVQTGEALEHPRSEEVVAEDHAADDRSEHHVAHDLPAGLEVRKHGECSHQDSGEYCNPLPGRGGFHAAACDAERGDPHLPQTPPGGDQRDDDVRGGDGQRQPPGQYQRHRLGLELQCSPGGGGHQVEQAAEEGADARLDGRVDQ